MIESAIENIKPNQKKDLAIVSINKITLVLIQIKLLKIKMKNILTENDSLTPM